MREVYRYTFQPSVQMTEVEASLLLATWSCEALHGESQFRLDAGHVLDELQHKLVIDATTKVGKDLNRILTGFLQREYKPMDFTVERVNEPAQPVGC